MPMISVNLPAPDRAGKPHNGRFAAYYRVSTEKQGRSGLGIEAQKEAVRTFLNGGNWTMAAEFEERESGKVADRPQLAAALAYCRKHKTKLVIAKLDRLTRDVKFLLTLLDSGIDVVFCDLPQVPPGPLGRFFLTQMAAIAELERGLISQRTKAALAAAAVRRKKAGKPGLGNPNIADLASKGGSVNKRRAKKFAADVMPFIREAREAGASSLRKIAAALTARGVKTARGGEWTAVQVHHILKRSDGNSAWLGGTQDSRISRV